MQKNVQIGISTPEDHKQSANPQKHSEEYKAHQLLVQLYAQAEQNYLNLRSTVKKDIYGDENGQFNFKEAKALLNKYKVDSATLRNNAKKLKDKSCIAEGYVDELANYDLGVVTLNNDTLIAYLNHKNRLEYEKETNSALKAQSETMGKQIDKEIGEFTETDKLFEELTPPEKKNGKKKG